MWRHCVSLMGVGFSDEKDLHSLCFSSDYCHCSSAVRRVLHSGRLLGEVQQSLPPCILLS